MFVNERIDMDWCLEMFYGWCLLGMLHFIVCFRAQNPGKKIYLSKYDYSDAYQRISHAASVAVQSILIFAGVAYLALRLAFGGSPNSAIFCAFLKALTDLANKLSCTDFEPNYVWSPVVETDTLEPREYLDKSVPIAEAIRPVVKVPGDAY